MPQRRRCCFRHNMTHTTPSSSPSTDVNSRKRRSGSPLEMERGCCCENRPSRRQPSRKPAFRQACFAQQTKIDFYSYLRMGCTTSTRLACSYLLLPECRHCILFTMPRG